jgi:tetratricopeptide (TPR) repeat protein
VSLKQVKSFEARRNFLVRCGRGVAGFLIPRWTVFSAPAFHLHPHYREQTPFDAALLQIEPGRDGFVSEQLSDSIAAILDTWSKNLLRSPHNKEAIEKILSGRFLGCPWQPVESHPLREAIESLDVRRLRFAPQPSLAPLAFANDLRSALASFSKILTAEFQITAIDPTSGGLTTQIRYEFVGTGPGFYREQRTGHWSLDWEAVTKGSYSIVRWRSHDEVRSRTTEPFYAEVTNTAFGSCPSYKPQMLHGADYWRTALDGASGIDIYGHNGVSVGDIDGNGRDSIYICQPAGLPNRLFRNRGDGTFDDITEASGVGLLDNTACAIFADFSNRGRQDLVIVRANGPLLFLNQGDGKFQLKPGAFEFANPPQGTFTGAAAADYNRDGLLDIYFCLYSFYQGAGQYKYPTPYFAAENGPPNFMMRNNGDGTFRDVTAQCGLNQNNTRYSFCCGWSDYNRDGWPDLYVVNDFGRKNLYRNQGDGTFRDVALVAGVGDIGAGMSVCWHDFDNDGLEDLYVANMWTAAGERITAEKGFQKTAPADIRDLYRKHAMGNSLFSNTAASDFRDTTRESQASVGRWSWSSNSFDFDHDGFADIYIANGMISGTAQPDLNSFFWRQVVAQSPNTAKPDAGYEQGWNAINEMIRSDYSWSGFERNIFYANNRDGTFSDISGALGVDFSEDSRTFALADFDGDGRQEILLKNRSAPQLRLLKNTISHLPPAMAFRLRGTKSNRDAIGVAITIETSSGQQTRLLQAGSGFLSQHSKELSFGLGEAKGSVSATIRWPSGLTQELKGLPPNHRIWLTEGLEPSKIEPYGAAGLQTEVTDLAPGEMLPETIETWLLAPIAAPGFPASEIRGKARLLTFSASDTPPGVGIHLDERSVPASDDLTAIYNLLFRYLFDRHRDLPLPASFLIDEQGQIVKIYQGQVDPQNVRDDFNSIPRTDSARLARALPFAGVSTTYQFGRNHLSLGSIFFQRGYMEASAGFFESALKNNPASAEAYYGLGSVYLKQAKAAMAKESFELAVKLTASYPETTPNAWNNLGLLAAREGETTNAIGYFEKALQIDPDHFIALENLGNAFRQQKRWDEARAILERALRIKPEDPEGNYALGMVFAQRDDNDNAFLYLQKALQARPTYPEALNNLGILYLRTRRLAEAVAEFEQCIRVAPPFDQSYLNLARVYATEGDREKARAVLHALLAQHPEHSQARQALEQLH